MPVDRTEILTVAHPCPCGMTVQVDPVHGGRCDACGEVLSTGFDEGAGLDALLQALVHGGNSSSSDETEPEVDPLIGQRLGHFRIMARLGEGGMGAVYRAMDESLQRYVALKVLSGPAEQDERHVARLLQEARAQARVNHPHVVHIYYVSRNEQTPFLAMELVHGPTLAQRLRSGPLPFREVIDMAIPIVEALQQAALYDIVHGDIKPGNILLGDGCAVKLSDFGLAQRLSDMQEQRDGIAGTPNYLSPEACRGETLDIRSDMYALGVMLFEMTFGRLPYTFDREGAGARIKAHCLAVAEFPEQWPEHLPEGWFEVLARLLAKNPRQRYWTYELLLEDLHALRPVSLPMAGRIVRGLAWIVDIIIASAVQRFTIGLFTAGTLGGLWSGRPWLQAIAALSGFLVPFLVVYLQSKWRTSPGKELVQISVVDVHGLAPRTSRLALRSVVSLLPLWHFAVQTVCDTVGMAAVGRALGYAVVGLLAIDATCLVLRPDRRSLHDILFRTQVVLGKQRQPRDRVTTGLR